MSKSYPANATSPPETLSRRVQRLREQLNLSITQLGQKANLTEPFLQDLEAGLEPFLSPAVRQKLARVLRVKLSYIQEVETPPPPIPDVRLDDEKKADMLNALIKKPDRVLFCPACGGKLVARLFNRQDLQGTPLTSFKIHCSQCLFAMEHEQAVFGQ
jgi:transcriptional regulator with XRE-family HTH domain